MDPEQLKEHLAFASELGITGVSRDPFWRLREATEQPRESTEQSTVAPGGAAEPDRTAAVTLVPGELGEPLTLARSVREVLDAIAADIGPQCSRCKLHRLGRTQV